MGKKGDPVRIGTGGTPMKMPRLRRRRGERSRKVQDIRCWARIGLGADLEKCTDWDV